MSKKGQLPELLFVSPIGCREKIRHKHIVLRVLSKRDGIPLLCQVMEDNETVNLQGGEEFITAYVQEQVLAKETPSC